MKVLYSHPARGAVEAVHGTQAWAYPSKWTRNSSGREACSWQQQARRQSRIPVSHPNRCAPCSGAPTAPPAIILRVRDTKGREKVLQKRLHMRHQTAFFWDRHYEKPSTGYGDLKNILLGGAYVAFSVREGVPRLMMAASCHSVTSDQQGSIIPDL